MEKAITTTISDGGIPTRQRRQQRKRLAGSAFNLSELAPVLIPTPAADAVFQAALHRGTTGVSGEKAAPPPRPVDNGAGEASGRVASEIRKGKEASRLIQEIGEEFTRLRADGRSGAWGDLQNKLMSNAYLLIEQGLMSPKDWISISIEIENFRKSEQGTHTMPGDYLSRWLSQPGSITFEALQEKR